MGIIREPENIEFEVDTRPLSELEKNQISEIISYYKKTGKVKKLSTPIRRSRKKETVKK